MVEKRNLVHRVPPSRSGGFTLIEVMIAVAIIGILAAIAYPSYTEYVYKGRRGDATAALLKIQQAQERWRSNNPSYGTLSTTLNNLAPYGVTLNSEKSYYSLESQPLLATPRTGYTATATVNSSNAQKNDKKCTSFTVTMSAGVITGARQGSCRPCHAASGCFS